MKKAITVILIVMGVMSARAASKTGYLLSVVDKRAKEHYHIKTADIDTLNQKIKNYAGFEVDIKEVFNEGNMFFKYRNNDILLYVEKKKIKQKSNGKLVFRKYSKKELQTPNSIL